MSLSGALAFGLPGHLEWVIVLVIALLIFGRRLPEVMRGLGGGVREFRKGIDGEDDDRGKGKKGAEQAQDNLQDQRQPVDNPAAAPQGERGEAAERRTAE